MKDQMQIDAKLDIQCRHVIIDDGFATFHIPIQIDACQIRYAHASIFKTYRGQVTSTER